MQLQLQATGGRNRLLTGAVTQRQAGQGNPKRVLTGHCPGQLNLLEHDDLIFPEGVIPNELRAFQQKESGNREAASGAHDDAVMALAFACHAIPETPNTAGFFAHI